MGEALMKTGKEGLEFEEMAKIASQTFTEGTQHYLDILQEHLGNGIPQLDLPMIVAALTLHATELTKLMDEPQKDLTETILKCIQMDVRVTKKRKE
jgi:hypothetical protein